MNVNETIYNMLVELVNYKLLILFFIFLLALALTGVLIWQLVVKIVAVVQEKETDAELLGNVEYGEMSRNEKATVLRRACCPDGINPRPLDHMEICDKGKTAYIASFTIAKMPKSTTFASTFSRLLNTNNCTSSIFIEPISEQAMTRKLDKHITVLESERIRAIDDPNRSRKLSGQEAEAEQMADSVERGDSSYYDVGFLFSIKEESYNALIEACDAFRSKAVAKGIEIASCYGLQAEAYLSNAPFNQKFSIIEGGVGIDSGIITHMFDKKALSTVFNYTQSDFSHRNGIPLGRNLTSRRPIQYDIYDKTHDGFCILVVGKTGSGKSVLIKVMCSRYRLDGYRFAAVDSQAIKGMNEGEYAQIATLMNGINFQISNKVGGDGSTNSILNFFDVDESTIYVRDGVNSGYEKRVLDLNDKIIQVVNNIFTMVQGTEKELPYETATFVEEILFDAVKSVYSDRGIVDGDPDSLYEMGSVIENGVLTNGKVRKKMPQISDAFKKILINDATNVETEKTKAFKIAIAKVKDYVKELYYAPYGNKIAFFTREEYLALPLKEEGSFVRVYTTETGKKVDVVEVHGVRAYYDGQTTVTLKKDCPFFNIDISQLTDSEKVVARQVGIDFINENFIKKNSENLKEASKCLVIFDEAHEEFAYEYARKTIDNVVRTARKRHVGIILSTQALKEYDAHEETRSILRNAAAKFVFKQDYQDREYLERALGITPSQVDRILKLGGSMDKNQNPHQSEKEKNAHRGEVCIIDGPHVAFMKVDYIKETERYAVETDATEISNMYTVRGEEAS